MNLDLNRSLKSAAAIASSVALCFATRTLLSWVHFMMLEPFHRDAPIYWTVGRGIVNGLIPYRDLFDYKMPGIFLISALSVELSNGPYFGYLLEALFAIALAILPPLGLFLNNRVRTWESFFGLVSLAAFCTMMSINLASGTAGFQTENFASFAAGLYAIVLFSTGERGFLVSSAILSPFILLAVGLKEPYAAIIAAVALIDARKPRRFFETFVVPFIVAALAGLLILALAGWLPAFMIYVHEILTVIKPGVVGMPRSVADRIFDLHPLAALGSFSPALAAAVVALLVINTVRPETTRTSIWNRGLRNVGALTLMTIAVNSGPYTDDHHLAMAVPVYLALYLFYRRNDMAQTGGLPASLIATGLSGLLLIASFQMPVPPFGNIEKYRAARTVSQDAADQIDDVLDACGNPPWASIYELKPKTIVVPVVTAFTRHSPVGPNFFMLSHFSRVSGFMRHSIMSSIRNADILVVQDTVPTDKLYADLAPAIARQIQGDFETQPWPCAKGKRLPTDGIQMLFKRGADRQRQAPASKHP